MSEQVRKNTGAFKAAVVIALIVAVAAVLYVKNQGQTQPAPVSGPGDAAATAPPAPAAETPAVEVSPAEKQALPKLVDLGADKCIPCKAMAPILEELREEYAGTLEVLFIDVWKNPGAGEAYGIQSIPTQIFYDASGKELFRHIGFFSKEDILAKWQELGVAVKPAANTAFKDAFSRWEPAAPDTRPKEQVCYLCDDDIAPATRTVMTTDAGEVAFCSPHCYIITFASLTATDKSHDSARVTVDASTDLAPVVTASYVRKVVDGRPAIRAFATEEAAKAEQEQSGGDLLNWQELLQDETSTCCAFCDRPVYPIDASSVAVADENVAACCVMCALGVAARSGKDIEVTTKDSLTGETVRVKTAGGHVQGMEPPSAVAWAGCRKSADGKTVSTGCFKQAFFANAENLRAWVEEHPTATGRQVTMEEALAAKMSLSVDQIAKACKIGECLPNQ